jgi:hypothetical protein
VRRIDPRLAWGHEARDFTPWLSEHVDELSAALGGVELQFEASEHPIGGFFADLIGTDLTTGAAFVIENQLADTDHGHLGQIITYAAGLDARMMVWVAPIIRDEHRQAIDWLNEISRQEYAFFAVRVELLCIGHEVAPDFVVVAGPNAWQKTIRDAAASGREGGRAAVYRDLWTMAIEKLRAIDPSLPPARAHGENWLKIRGGNVWLTFSAKGPRAEVYWDDPDASGVFELLHAKRTSIEEQLGPLSWEALPDRQAVRIARYLGGSWDVPASERSAMLDGMISAALELREKLEPMRREAQTDYRARAADDEGGPGPPSTAGGDG